MERYRQLSQSTTELPLFLRAWWLDATCGADGWGVSLVERGEHIVGALPYLLRKRYGKTVITQPRLTQFLGPWISSTTGRASVRLGREKDIMEALIAQLPPYAQYAQSWSPEVTNWLPFYWAGFRQTTLYTMRLRQLTDLDAVWQGLQANARTDIRKAEARFGVRMRESPTLAALLEVNAKTFARQSKLAPYDAGYVDRIDAACAARQCRRFFIAEDADGRAHAGAYIVWDDSCAYYLLGGGDPALRNSGATSYCMWKAIRFAGTVTRAFDFEGSMLEPVERFFRSFGPEQIPYHRVTHSRSRIFRLREAIASLG